MQFLTMILQRALHALGVALLHVLLFLCLHGVVTLLVQRELPRILDDAIEIASEAVTYTVVQ